MAAPRRSRLGDDAEVRSTFRGGFGRGPWYANQRLRPVTLTVRATGVRVGPSVRLLSSVIPTWDASFVELFPARIRGRRLRTDVRHETADGPTITFSPRSPDPVVAAPSEAGADLARGHEVGAVRCAPIRQP